jgi:DNA-binding Lrp family transcriptional regulator
MELNKKDKKLLYELSLNSRISVRELSRKLKLPKSTVNYRIQKLIQKGIISGFRTYYDFGKLGLLDFVLKLKFQNLDAEKEAEITSYLLKNRHVMWLGSSYGKWELMIELGAENIDEIFSFLSGFNRKYNKYILKKELLQSISESFFGFKNDEVKNPKVINLDFIGREAKLDKTDKKIVEYLIKKPDYNLYELAEEISISLNNARKRIKNMIDNKVILGYSAQIDISKLNLGWYIIGIVAKDSSNERKLIEFLKNHPNVLYFYKYLGEIDYEIGLCIKDSKELEKIIREIKIRFPEMIQDYEFYIMTNYIKK